MINIRHPHITLFAEKHYQSIIEYCGKSTAVTTKDLKEVDDWLSEYIPEYDLKKIVLAKPDELKTIKGLLVKNVKKDFPQLLKLYSKFASKTGGMPYNSIQLIENLEISVCPYCNRNFIYNAKQRRTSEFDHFYPKSKYPLLAISFYNLIPSCKICNHAKKDKTDELINPYDQKYDWNKLLKFKLKIKAADFYYNPNSIEIIPENNGKEEAELLVKNAIKIFNLKDLYNHHADFVIELIQKKYAYNEDYLTSLFKQYEGTLFRNREDLLRLVTTNYIDEKDLKNRPLAKLTKDIVEQLDL